MWMTQKDVGRTVRDLYRASPRKRLATIENPDNFRRDCAPMVPVDNTTRIGRPIPQKATRERAKHFRCSRIAEASLENSNNIASVCSCTGRTITSG